MSAFYLFDTYSAYSNNFRNLTTATAALIVKKDLSYEITLWDNSTDHRYSVLKTLLNKLDAPSGNEMYKHMEHTEIRDSVLK